LKHIRPDRSITEQGLQSDSTVPLWGVLIPRCIGLPSLFLWTTIFRLGHFGAKDKRTGQQSIFSGLSIFMKSCHFTLEKHSQSPTSTSLSISVLYPFLQLVQTYCLSRSYTIFYMSCSCLIPLHRRQCCHLSRSFFFRILRLCVWPIPIVQSYKEKRCSVRLKHEPNCLSLSIVSIREQSPSVTTCGMVAFLRRAQIHWIIHSFVYFWALQVVIIENSNTECVREITLPLHTVKTTMLSQARYANILCVCLCELLKWI
jgi:hypothetical protein